MRKTAGITIEKLIAQRQEWIAMVTELATQIAPAGIPRGMTLELVAEAMEEALDTIWKTRRTLGAQSTELIEAKDPVPTSTATRGATRGKPRGRKPGRKTKDEHAPSPDTTIGPSVPPEPGTDEFTLS